MSMSSPVWEDIDAYKLWEKDLLAHLKTVFPEQQAEIEVEVRSYTVACRRHHRQSCPSAEHNLILPLVKMNRSAPDPTPTE